LDCDVAVVGAGFGGSILAMIATRLGYRATLLERGRHPRFAIGESASPLAGIVLEQLADRYDLPRIRPLSTYGTWQRTYPEIVCGLKRGFTYFRHEDGQSYRAAADRSNQLLVAASPSDELSDTHWLRSDVDHFLMREATALGVDYVDQLELDGVDWNGDGSPTLRGRRLGQDVAVRARFVVDASGPNGFLRRALDIPNIGFDGYPPTQALFSHFTGVARCADMPDYRVVGPVGPPYPPDDAALHHVFNGGWMWVLRFGNGVTSAGVAVSDDLAADLRLADGAPAWRRLLARYPSIAAQFADAQPIREFTWMPRLAWRAEVAAGPGWAMLPSAAAFVDPLFSTGIPLTLLGIERMARILEGGPEGPPLRSRGAQGATAAGPPLRSRGAEGATAAGPPLRGRGAHGVTAAGPPFDDYGDITLVEADHTARFIAGCYAAFPRFDEFTAYSMFYFAAASFSEMARRLRVDVPSARFLCADRPAFRHATERLSPALAAACSGDDYARQVREAIEPLNIAGLCEPAKRNWYPVDPGDVVRGAGKLGVSASDVVDALTASGVVRRT
jgi:tetracycline 7-halogenase / FADH2 O2-dependent halogenase